MFFTSAVTRLRQSLDLGSNARKFTHVVNHSLPDFKFKMVDESFTLNALRQLKTNKSGGLDDISPRLLKDAAEVISKPLTQIINASLSQGIVPHEWKHARVTPLFKKGVSTDLDNYRPISVLPVVSKLLERAVHHQLYSFCNEHKLLSPFQCGFRSNHSTEFAAVAFSDYVRRGMDQGLLTGAVFIDLRKAFDSVDHDLLISKLQSYGLKNIELNWFKSYLLDRKQVVRIGTETSDYCTITSGVPQGSILGPLLFVLFINDLPNVLTKCRILMYADDTVMYFSAADSQVIADTLTNELLLVNKWLIDNNLFMHEGKTECMLFGTGPKLALSTSFSIAIDGKALNRVSEYKYLGIVLDASLTWNAHVDYLIGKVRKRLAMLGRIRKNINMYTAGTVYTSFVLPILDYCDTVWSCCGSVNTDKLEKLQRRAARIIMHLGSSEKALNFLGYVTLEKRRKSHVCNLVKKCLSNRCPQFFMNYFNYNRDILPRKTRSSDKLRLPTVRLECTKKAFFYHGCVIFNQNF